MRNAVEPTNEEKVSTSADAEPPRNEASEVDERKARILKFVLVLGVAFLMPVVSSIRLFVVGPPATAPSFLHLRAVILLFNEITALALMAYVLCRQNVTTFAVDFRLRDIPHSLVLAFASYLACGVAQSTAYILYTAVNGHAPPLSVNWLAQMSGSAIAIIVVCVNPFYEELIVRAFTITEVEALTGSIGMGIFVSVGIQTAYHLYQGLVAAAGVAALFLVFSAYFSKYRRITPVILAHLYFDFFALILAVRK